MSETGTGRALAALESTAEGRRLAQALIAYGQLLEHDTRMRAVALLHEGRLTRHELGAILGEYVSLEDERALLGDLGVCSVDERGRLYLTTLGRDVVAVDDAQSDGKATLWAGRASA